MADALRVVDSNVYISGLNFGGLPEAVLRLAQAGAFVLCLSPPIEQETRRILAEKFAWAEPDIDRAFRKIRKSAHLVIPAITLTEAADPDDNRVLECAVTAQADLIVSGDNDLRRLGRYRDIPILNPRQFLDSEPWRSE